jgi:hypothetical protein
MKISKTMVKYYLSYLTVGYFGDHAEPAENLEEYAPIVRNIRVLAERAGDLPWLRVALEHLLTNPGVNLKEYDGGHYPFSREQIEEILYYLWKTLWPDAQLGETGEGPAVQLLEMSADDWLNYRKSLSAA